MTTPRFLQIHTLHSYTAALLNRDDSGQAKRLVYGGTSRTRISSQCLKRHWRMAREESDGRIIRDDPHALQHLAGYVDSKRSREVIEKRVIAPLAGHYSAEVLQALTSEMLNVVYGKEGSPQPLLFGEPEIEWLAAEGRSLAEQANGDPKKVKELAAAWAGKDNKNFKNNWKVFREGRQLPAGLVAALFGRMVTSDPAANIDAPIHVAHAFTVHAAESEADYFAVVNDLQTTDDPPGADHISETEITCGLFYGYVVIDLPGLISNLGGDSDLASRVTHNLLHLIAEVSPGAKLGSTAPYGRADMMLVEAGDRQPRSLATSYRKAIPHDLSKAIEALDKRLKEFDAAYATGEERRQMCVEDEIDGIEKGSLAALAEWAAAKVKEAGNA